MAVNQLAMKNAFLARAFFLLQESMPTVASNQVTHLIQENPAQEAKESPAEINDNIELLAQIIFAPPPHNIRNLGTNYGPR